MISIEEHETQQSLLRRIMRGRNLTAAAVAECCGVNPRTVRRWLAESGPGAAAMPVNAIIKLAKTESVATQPGGSETAPPPQ